MIRLIFLLAIGLLAFPVLAQTNRLDKSVDHSKTSDQEVQLYRDWSKAEDYRATQLAKQYLDKYPSGEYADYLRSWLTPLERVEVPVVMELVKLRCHVVQNYTFENGNS